MNQVKNSQWSAPEVLEPYHYSNRFGEVTFTPVTDFMPIGDISIDKIPAIKDVLISMDDAEKVTLVTENRRGYVSFCFPFLEGNTCFGLQYSCPNRAAVCRIDILESKTDNGMTAQEQIDLMAPKSYGPLSII